MEIDFTNLFGNGRIRERVFAGGAGFGVTGREKVGFERDELREEAPLAQLLTKRKLQCAALVQVYRLYGADV